MMKRNIKGMFEILVGKGRMTCSAEVQVMTRETQGESREETKTGVMGVVQGLTSACGKGWEGMESIDPSLIFIFFSEAS